MLSESILEELLRRSALSEELAQALWPDLSVDSKLQLIAAYQADISPPPRTGWLTSPWKINPRWFSTSHCAMPTCAPGETTWPMMSSSSSRPPMRM